VSMDLVLRHAIKNGIPLEKESNSHRQTACLESILMTAKA